MPEMPATEIGAKKTYFIPKPIPESKFIIWSLSSLGLYVFFWSYWQWRYIKEKHNQDISPFWRSFFIFFWLYQLISQLQWEAKEKNIEEKLIPGLILALYIILRVSLRLPHPYSIIAIWDFVPIMPAVFLSNQISLAESGGIERERYAYWWEYIIVMIGGAIMLLAAIGMVFTPHKG